MEKRDIPAFLFIFGLGRKKKGNTKKNVEVLIFGRK